MSFSYSACASWHMVAISRNISDHYARGDGYSVSHTQAIQSAMQQCQKEEDAPGMLCYLVGEECLHNGTPCLH
ncbi:hypothetical protein [Celerinatantimonas sp. MCCC 1A17872]|uniref:hypothetical protein n=1 Tax=Celerinatantimonas sp. MCCC 1A17872 TaxID=3177514 RepID=UPI0038C5453F